MYGYLTMMVPVYKGKTYYIELDSWYYAPNYKDLCFDYEIQSSFTAITSQSACTNIGFENGTLSGWTPTYGYAEEAPTNWQTPMYEIAGVGTRPGTTPYTGQTSHTLVTAANGNDPIGGFPQLAPGGGTYSLKLGANNCGAEAEGITQMFDVTSTNSSFTYQYAIVMDNTGGHTSYQQPFFKIVLKTETGDTISCSKFVVSANASLPGFATVTGVFDGLTRTLVYKPWSSVNVDLASYIGQKVIIEFSTGDCTLLGHYGYAYVDASCSQSTLGVDPQICQGSNATLTAPTGYASYSWAPGGQTTQSITVSVSGNYTVWVTGQNGCSQSFVSTVTVNPSISSATLTPTNVSCFNGTNGQLSSSITGGTPGYTYNWSPSAQTTATATGLSAGVTYTLTVTDSKGCSTTSTGSVTQPTLLTSSVPSLAINCFGGNGSATVTPGGGTPSYSYLWSPSAQTNATATGLSAGTTYTVTVTDNKGCTSQSTVTPTQPTLLSTSIPALAINCFGGTGSATINPSGGTPAYTYLWNPSGQTTSTATGLSAGTTYTAVVTDNKGCTSQSTVTPTQPTLLTSSVSPLSLNCFGNTGSSTVTPGGGSPAYTYVWNPSGQTTATATGLTSGNTYTVIVTDNKGCTSQSTVTPTQPTQLTSSASTLALSCFGNTGSSTVTPGGGTPNYSYIWSPSGQTTATATGLSAGTTYTVITTDNLGCTSQTTVTPTQPALLTSSIPSLALNCFGTTGNATVNVNGGTPGYNYSWNNGQTTATVTGITAGATYTVIISDNNGCTSQATITPTQPTQLTTQTSSTSTNCSGGSGTASVVANGGTPGYTYSWNNGQTTATATGLGSGTFTIIVTDNLGCTSQNTATVINTSGINSTLVSSNDVSCFNGTNGSATTNTSGGTPGYSYSWNNGQTTANLSNVGAGTYTLIVTDQNNCLSQVSVTIQQPTQLAASSSTVNATCNGNNNGSITLTPSGGTPGYTYSWIPSGQTGVTLSNLNSGTYTVIVSDLNNCTTQHIATVTEPTAITTATSATQTNCSGGSGTTSVVANGGTPGYTYSWNNGQTTATATGLSGGMYIVIVTDNNGCTKTDSVQVVNANGPVATISSTTNPLCFGTSNGNATINVSGGTPGYTYSWNNGQTTAYLSNVPAGSYTVIISDVNSCTSSLTVNITQPQQLTANVNASSIPCYGDTTSITTSLSGGTPGFTYSWSNGQTTSTATGIAAGSYTVTITDNNGCTTSATVGLLQPSVLTISASGSSTNCNGTGGTGTSIANGGTPNYTYSWNNGQTTASLSNLTGGTYTVIVTDANGCSTSDTIQVTALQNPIATASPGTTICLGNSASLTANGGGSYSWYQSNGLSCVNCQSPTATPSTNTTYTVLVTAANGCTATDTVNINVEDPAASFTPTLSDSIAPVTVTLVNNSTGAITYSWLYSNGDSSGLFTPVPVTFDSSGTHTIMLIVTSPNGCKDTTLYTFTTIDKSVISVPNVFTPNGDGINDFFTIPNIGLRDLHVMIFNRWGTKIYEFFGPKGSWDGRNFAGQLCSDGTYYYILSATGLDNEIYEDHGYVTILMNTK
jgi:gliding motility-associated-like protein